MPEISITGVFGVKPAAREAVLDGVGDRGRGRLAHGAAFLADQEHHRIAAVVILHAGDEGVAAFDAVNQTPARAGNRARDRW